MIGDPRHLSPKSTLVQSSRRYSSINLPPRPTGPPPVSPFLARLGDFPPTVRLPPPSYTADDNRA
ncbi:hypothetical protein K431DRAFT_281200 [Polychaeton citri CBS 116435]|uniref:Uncharacterized protein n=1 Tax=Polychaeton citri CBS 116435 TaxID=1314669 RepID=A0A9P4QDI4_9PEZI|nr:hypothetical protein K431DRAFT_281200 [Polychaeton citri CBS 116435]